MLHLSRSPMFSYFLNKAGIFILLILSVSCKLSKIDNYTESKEPVVLQPDYAGITIPCNIAPMNFRIGSPGKEYRVKFKGSHTIFEIRSKNGKIQIPAGKWENLLKENKGAAFEIEIFIHSENGWVKYPVIRNRVSEEAIDPYLVYRLIAPGYELWKEMGIYQRCLENFDQEAVMTNNLSDQNCMNCHNFRNNDPNTMLMHMRGSYGGTYLLKDDKLSKVNLKTDKTISAGVYPSWHPSGNLVAFSNNKTAQFFHALPGKRIEVFDLQSDIVLYDINSNKVAVPQQLSSKEHFETFPAWSPDGKYLYYCSAPAGALKNYDQVRYSLLRIGFNQKNNSFGTVDTIYSASRNRKSVSFPRVSPDGKWIIITVSNYGNFSIWHKEADLYAVNTSSGSTHKLDIGGDEAESFHSWSSKGNWLVFSSRCDDGQFTRPYFCQIDKTTGKNTKPFVLPQEDPDFYDTFLKAFNVPELVTGKVPLSPNKFRGVIQDEAIQAKD